MRIPGTFNKLWEQLKTAPTPVASISIPTEHGPLVLTFAVPEQKEQVPAKQAAPVKTPSPSIPEPHVKGRSKSDVVGAFTQPPEFRDPPFTKVDA